MLMRKMREENFVKSVWGNFRLEKKYISAVAAGLFLVVIYLMASASNAQDMKTEMVSASISENLRVFRNTGSSGVSAADS